MKSIKAVIKLAVLALAANATWHFFLAYSAHYKLRDAAQYAAQSRGEKSDEQIHDEIMGIVAGTDVPLTSEGVRVTHDGLTTTVSASYSRAMELLPTITIDVPFSFTVYTYAVRSPNSVGLPK